MVYVRVITVGLAEVGRALSTQVASALLVRECKKLITGGASPSVLGGCWIEAYSVPEGAVEAALKPGYDIKVHRWVGVDQFHDVIAQAHEKGWMSNGDWITATPEGQSACV